MQHDDEGLASVGWVVAAGGNVTGGAQRVECHPSNELGVADHPCIFTIITVGTCDQGRVKCWVIGVKV